MIGRIRPGPQASIRPRARCTRWACCGSPTGPPPSRGPAASPWRPSGPRERGYRVLLLPERPVAGRNTAVNFVTLAPRRILDAPAGFHRRPGRMIRSVHTQEVEPEKEPARRGPGTLGRCEGCPEGRGRPGGGRASGGAPRAGSSSGPRALASKARRVTRVARDTPTAAQPARGLGGHMIGHRLDRWGGRV